MAFYLEDYMENLELLPDEIKNGLEVMGQLDTEVKDCMVRTNKRINNLFLNAGSMNSNELQTSFDAIIKDGEKSIDKSDNKIKIASNMQDLLKKYLNRLDDDLHTMKTELEANSSGITEIIEQNVEQSIITEQNENKNQLKRCHIKNKKKISKNNGNSKRKSRTIPSHTITSENITTISKNDTNIATSLMSLAIKPVKTDDKVIEAAASKAVIATQQESTEGREQVSLRTSLRAVKSNQPLTDQKPSVLEKLPKEVLIKEELARVYELLNTNVDKKEKFTELDKIQKPGTSTEEDVDMNESVGSNEILYCICKNVAYGSMVACDNKECPSEWFHYKCVGIKSPPKGKWFCPQCIAKMKIRKAHK